MMKNIQGTATSIKQPTPIKWPHPISLGWHLIVVPLQWNILKMTPGTVISVTMYLHLLNTKIRPYPALGGKELSNAKINIVFWECSKKHGVDMSSACKSTCKMLLQAEKLIRN